MVSYTGNILGIQNQIIPFGALSIRWNKLQSLLVTTVMNDSFQFTTCQYKCNLLWLPLSFLIYNIGNSKLAFRWKLEIISDPLSLLISSSIMVLLQGLCYVVDITMVFLTFIGIFDFVFHLVELSRGLLLLNLPLFD